MLMLHKLLEIVMTKMYTCVFLLAFSESFYRKIHYLMGEFFRDSCDISFCVQFNTEFTSQVMNFP